MPDLVRLSYHSTCSAQCESELSDILAESLNNNLHSEITACLFTTGNTYYQFIEGPRDTVLKLFERITDDPRHSDVCLDQIVKIQARLFSRWAMATLSDTDVTHIMDGCLPAGKETHLFAPDTHDKALDFVALLLHKRETRNLQHTSFCHSATN
jgi:hypothetical protein